MRNRNTTSKSSKSVSTSTFQKLERSGGRFFGISLQNGERINAQYRGQTEKYLMVYDRNRTRDRRLLKTNVASVNI